MLRRCPRGTLLQGSFQWAMGAEGRCEVCCGRCGLDAVATGTGWGGLRGAGLQGASGAAMATFGAAWTWAVPPRRVPVLTRTSHSCSVHQLRIDPYGTHGWMDGFEPVLFVLVLSWNRIHRQALTRQFCMGVSFWRAFWGGFCGIGCCKSLATKGSMLHVCARTCICSALHGFLCRVWH